MRTNIATIVSLAAVAGLGARAAAPTDACALLTQAEVSAALSVAVQPGERVIASSPVSCGWAPAGGPTIGGKKVVATLMTERSFTVGKTPVRGILKEPVAGIGDDAYYITTPPFGTGLSVRKGVFCFQVRVSGFPPDKTKAIERTLAMNVLARA